MSAFRHSGESFEHAIANAAFSSFKVCRVVGLPMSPSSFAAISDDPAVPGHLPPHPTPHLLHYGEDVGR